MAMSINFMDLKTQYRNLEPLIRQRIDAVLEHGRYCMGPEVTELEQRLGQYTGSKHVLACSSGTDALLIPLMAYGIGPGDAVFTTPFTFIATSEVVSLLGATPVFVDINEKDYNLDVSKLEDAILRVKNEGKLTPRGIIPVDLFGLNADYTAINEIAARNNLFVIEDAAQSLGARTGEGMACSLGHVGATSFYPAKPLGCYGDGGAIFTDDTTLNNIMESIRVHGQGEDKYNNVRLGINGRLDSIQAGILLAKLDSFDDEIEARNRVALRYNEKLRGVQTPVIPEGGRCAWALYSIRAEKRDQLQAHLKEAGIPSVVYYVKSLHLQDMFAHLGHQPGDFPVSEAVQADILSLPMHPFLTDDEIDRVVDAVNGFYA